MDSSHPTALPHLSRNLDISPERATEAFDALVAEGSGQAAPGTWTVEVPGGRVEVTGPGIVSRTTRTARPYRRVEGHLWPTGSWRGIPMELELLPSSDLRIELVMTLATRRNGSPLSPVHRRAYFRVGNDVLRALGAALERRSHEPDADRGEGPEVGPEGVAGVRRERSAW